MYYYAIVYKDVAGFDVLCQNPDTQALMIYKTKGLCNEAFNRFKEYIINELKPKYKIQYKRFLWFKREEKILIHKPEYLSTLQKRMLDTLYIKKVKIV